jgi:predicted PurR-regulated permease PerM
VTLQRQIIFWGMALLAFIFLLWLLSPIMLPFLAGLALAYFLDPIADFLEARGLPRVAASLVILMASLLLLVLIGILVLPMLTEQFGKLIADLPRLLQALASRFNEVAPIWLKRVLLTQGGGIEALVGQFGDRLANWTTTLAASVWSGSMAIINLVSLLVVTPVVAFYLLADWDRLVAKVDGWLPRDHVHTIRQIALDVDRSLAGFIRGQGTVCILLGIFYAAGLTLAGLSFGLAIGAVAGALTFIPYVGALIGGVLALGVALVQFWPDYVSIGIVAAIFVVGQFIEGNFLSPKLVGSSIGLHPVWVIFAMLAFGYLLGFVGLLIAVPLSAAAGVLVRFALDRYLHSKLYRGSSAEQSGPEQVRKLKAK